MNIQTRVRILAAGSLLALTLAGVSAVQQAHAQPYVDRNTYALCSYYNRYTGEWEFYGPGDTVSVADGNGHFHRLMCIAGQWHDTTALGAAQVSPVVGPQTGGVFVP